MRSGRHDSPAVSLVSHKLSDGDRLGAVSLGLAHGLARRLSRRWTLRREAAGRIEDETVGGQDDSTMRGSVGLPKKDGKLLRISAGVRLVLIFGGSVRMD